MGNIKSKRDLIDWSILHYNTREVNFFLFFCNHGHSSTTGGMLHTQKKIKLPCQIQSLLNHQKLNV